jgi:hypothetical protein
MEKICEKQPETFKFERKRLGKSTKYGPYLYRNTTTGVLIASHESPFNEKPLTTWDDPKVFMLLHDAKPPTQIFTLKKELFNGSDIGLYSDALVYYKNE